MSFVHPLDRIDRRPLTCIWEITRRCNLRCVHCENRCGESSSRELSGPRLLAIARDLRTLGCEEIHVTGGEPLVRPDWDDLCGQFVALGFKVGLITNGTLFDQAARTRARAAGVGVVGISLDGTRATHDAIRRSLQGSPFDQTVTVLTDTLAQFDTVVITQINRRNLAELPELRGLLFGLGVRRWQLQLCIPVGRVRELGEPFIIAPAQLEELLAFIAATNRNFPLRIETGDSIGYYGEHELGLRDEHAPRFWTGCQAGMRLVAITYDGRVRGCSALPPEFDAGDLHDEDMTTIWNDRERFAYSTRFDPNRLTGACARCRVGALCRAGCTTMAFWTTGTIYENPYCLQRVRGCV